MNNFPHGVIRPSVEGRPWFVGSNQMPSAIQREQPQQQLQDRIIHEQNLPPHLQRKQHSHLSMPKQHEEQHAMDVDRQHLSDHRGLQELHQQQQESRKQQLLLERHRQHQVMLEQQHQVLSQRQHQHQVVSERQQQHQAVPERQQQHQALPEQQQQHQVLSERQQQHQVLSERQPKDLPSAKLGIHHHSSLGQPERGHSLSALDHIEEQSIQLHSHHDAQLEQHRQSPAIKQDEHAKAIPGISETFRQIANQHGIAVTTGQSAQQLSTAVTAKSGLPNLVQLYRKATSSNMGSVFPGDRLGVAENPATASSFNPFSTKFQALAFSASQASLEKQYGTAIHGRDSPTEQDGAGAPLSGAHLDTALESSLRHGGFGASQVGPKKPSAAQMSEYFPLPVPLGSQPVKPKMDTKSSEDLRHKCDQCGICFTSATQLKHHLLAHFEEIVNRTGAKQELKQRFDNSETSDVPMKGDCTTQQQENPPPKKLKIDGASSAESGTESTAGPSMVDSKTWLENQMEGDSTDKTPAEGELTVSLPRKKLAPKPEKNHQCSVCAKRFVRLDHLKRHFRKCHTEVKTEEPGGETFTPHHLGLIRNKPPKMNIRKNDGPFQCFVCGKCFKRADHMKRHVTKTHPDFVPTETPRLPITMKLDVRSLYGHRTPPKRSKSGEPKLPTTPLYTEAEMAEKRHVCITCDKRFKRQDHLKRHATIHTGEKPHTCSHCGKGFRREHHLQRHERTHTGEKPYECVTCGKKFSREDHMKKHNRSHIFDSIRKPGEKMEDMEEIEEIAE